jgi:hypothetical protein
MLALRDRYVPADVKDIVRARLKAVMPRLVAEAGPSRKAGRPLHAPQLRSELRAVHRKLTSRLRDPTIDAKSVWRCFQELAPSWQRRVSVTQYDVVGRILHDDLSAELRRKRPRYAHISLKLIAAMLAETDRWTRLVVREHSQSVDLRA